MTIHHPTRLLAAVTLLTACNDDLWADIESRFPVATTTGTTADDPDVVPTTTHEPLPPVQTVTGASDGDGDGASDPTTTDATTSDPIDPPPQIYKFYAEKTSWNAPGPVPLTLIASDDVVVARLFRGPTQVAESSPTDYPHIIEYPLLSARDNGEFIKVVVEDASHQSAELEIPLHVKLPPPGTVQCTFQDVNTKASRITALVYQENAPFAPPALLAAGARDTGSGERATLWKLPTQGCKGTLSPLPGWPKTLDAWSAVPQATGRSSAVAVALDSFGSFALAANLRDDADVTRPYVAMFSADGALVWEKSGTPGDELTALAILPDHSVLAVGAAATVFSTDVGVWHYKPKGTSATITPHTLAAPFNADEELDPENKLNERANAVVLSPQGPALIAGEREYRDQFNVQRRRAFTVRFDPTLGTFSPPWTSIGDNKKNDAILALTTCSDQFLAGGSSGDNLVGDFTTTPLIRWLTPDGGPSGLRDASMTAARIHAIACDREGKVVSAGTRDAGLAPRARVFALREAEDPIIYYINTPGEQAEDSAFAVDCDALGYCAAAGYRVVDGKQTAVLRVHSP